MNNLIAEASEKVSSYVVEITLLVIVGIILVLSIVILTLVKKLKDK